MVFFTDQERADWFQNLPAKPCGAAMICVNSAGLVLSVKATYKHHWSLPGGVVDKGEAPLRAALRELHEEAGIILRPSDVEFAAVVHHQPPDEPVDTIYFLFIARNVDAQSQIGHDEIDQVEWITPDQLKVRSNNKDHIVLAADIAAGAPTGLYHEVNS